ncbi:MAG: response regulator [Lachnospiraceae bacterium]|nr:response regulator [Lachnospiraceae bacterium]
MGRQLVWQDRFNIGVEVIDREHRKLFSIMNKLLEFTEDESKSQWVCEEGIKYFKGHAMKHFTEEEVYMASINYKGFETHRRIHDNFRKKTLPELEKELKQTRYAPDSIKHFLGVCAGWLIGHTLTEDCAITGKTLSKWKNLLPEEEQTAMKLTIRSLVYDLFRLKAQVISEHYGGEKFGKGVYYRLVYGNESGKNWEILLAFEEKLLLGTVGKLMDTKSDKINVMLMNTTRYTAQQFVSRIGEHFPSLGLSEVREENLLTYEQFQTIFGKGNPRCSLLFHTGGSGYFAYCMFTPHSDEGEAVSIKAENAITEIKKYLKNNKEDDKKKVLVVDDSAVVLKMVKELLEEDYQVTLAKSGVSAIQCMTLDRPDLVLLDYEMPVCDGKQVLEMIRSEREFADIPVYFLTGNMDRQKIEQVLTLRPTGYLLKSLKPREIKKTIDGFFQI